MYPTCDVSSHTPRQPPVRCMTTSRNAANIFWSYHFSYINNETCMFWIVSSADKFRTYSSISSWRQKPRKLHERLTGLKKLYHNSYDSCSCAKRKRVVTHSIRRMMSPFSMESRPPTWCSRVQSQGGRWGDTPVQYMPYTQFLSSIFSFRYFLIII